MKISRLVSSNTSSNTVGSLSRVAGALIADPFPVGSMVYLRNQPGPWGTVLGTRAGKVFVRWLGLGVGSHLASSLILASAPDEDDRENEDEQEEQQELE